MLYGETAKIHPIRRCSAKHPDSSEQQLTSVAGSLGYLAPEVLNQTGARKARRCPVYRVQLFLSYRSFMKL
jgi:hypothetical protein